MKNKERKMLAKKIAKAEYIIQHSDDEYAIKRAKQEIMDLSGQAQSLDDMLIIDEMVQELLADMT